MKIEIEMNGSTFSAKTEGDDLNISEMVNHIKGLLVLCGYHPKGVDEAFTPDEFEWFPEEQKIENYLKSEGFEEVGKVTISPTELENE